jgi:hypothetical protein
MGHGERMGETKNACKTLVSDPERTIQLGDLGIDGKINLKWMLRGWTSFIWLRIW